MNICFRCYRSFLSLLLLFWGTLLCATAQSAPLMLHDNDTPLVLDTSFEILRDPSGQLTLAQVQQQSFSSITAPQALHLGYTTDVVWLKLQLQSQSDTALTRVIHFRYGYLDHLTAYRLSDKGTSVLYSGFAVPPAERAIADPTPAFPVQLAPGEHLTVYIRVQAYGSMTLNAGLYNYADFHQNSNQHLLFQVIFAGMFLALWCYNLFLGLVLKQRPYLSYSAFLLLFGITTVTAIGPGSLYLWPLLGAFINHVVPTGYATAVVLALLFARDYMATKERAPWVDNSLKWAACVCALAAFATVLLPIQSAVKIMSAMGVSIAALMMACGIFGVYRHIPAARYFLVGWSCMLVGTALVSLRNTGLIPDNFITFYGMQIGSTIEMLMLSLGLASRFNEMKQQKELAQQALVQALRLQEQLLEERVQQRTKELLNAKNELQAMVNKDPLTQLANRNGLELQLTDAYQRAIAQRRMLALLLIDLDDFKPVNDQHGHAMGDHLLTIVARRLATCTHDNDAVARLGGDEFVLLSDRFSNSDDLKTFAEQVKQLICQAILLPNGKTVVVGASVGICFGDPRLLDATALMRRADSAMYLIKHHDKNDIAIDDICRRVPAC